MTEKGEHLPSVLQKWGYEVLKLSICDSNSPPSPSPNTLVNSQK